jgi:hypothetical protein
MARLDGTKLGPATVVALAFTAACSSSGVRATGTTSGGGHGGAANQGGSTTSSVASTSVVTVGTGSNGFGGSGGSGGAVAGCNPPAAPGSLWELDGLRYPDFQPVSMCQYRGDVTLIVNTAAI